MTGAPKARPEVGQVLSVGAGRVLCPSAAFGQLSAEILRAGHDLRFRARGTSMSPLVRDGDRVLVRPVDPSSVRVGDVVLCSSQPDRVVVHRVVSRLAGPDGPHLTVQGDGLSRPDGSIPAGRIYGRVVAVERGGAHVDMDHPLVKVLSRVAALRSRWNVGHGHRSRFARRLVKRLPGLSRYLA